MSSSEARISVANATGQFHVVTSSNDMLMFTSSQSQRVVIGVGSDGTTQSTAKNYLSVGSNDTVLGYNLVGKRSDATWSNAGNIIGSKFFGDGSALSNLIATSITGVLSSTQGGTGATEGVTGSGANVLSADPTFTGKLQANYIGIDGNGIMGAVTQGTYIDWNNDNTGKTFIMNHKGLGTGGFTFGEIDPVNGVDYTEKMSLHGNGNLEVTGIITGDGSGLTSLPAASITGILPVAQGGTGATGTTGSGGSNVLSISPILTGTVGCSNLTTTGDVRGTNVVATWSNAGDIIGKNITSTGALKANGTLEVTGMCTFSNASINALAIVGGVSSGFTVDDSDSNTFSMSNVSVMKNNATYPEWANVINTTGESICMATTSDANGNVYVTGFYASSTDIYLTATVLLKETTTIGLGNSPAAVFVVKYNSAGVAQWATSINSYHMDEGTGIAVDAGGNVYVTGYYNNVFTNLILDASAPSVILPWNNMGSSAVFIVKYNSSGVPQWAKKIDGAGNDVGRAIAVDANANVYVTGIYNSNTSTTLQGSVSLPISTDATYVVKYDTSGVPQWATLINGAIPSTGSGGIAVDQSGNVYVVGNYNSASAITLAADAILPSTSGTASFVIKYSTTGIAQWANQVDKTIAFGIATDSGGNAYMTGHYTSSSALTLAPSVILNATAGNSQAAIVVKYNTSGVPQWATVIDGASNEVSLAIATDPSGNVYVTGYYQSNVALTLAAGAVLGPTGYGAFIVKYNTAGIAQMATNIESAIGGGITSDAFGNIYVIGHYNSSVNITLQPTVAGVPNIVLANTGGNRAFIVKYSRPILPTYMLISSLSTPNGFYKLLVNASASPVTVAVRNAANTATLKTITVNGNDVKTLTWYGSTYYGQ
jgi:hypothetical protein